MSIIVFNKNHNFIIDCVASYVNDLIQKTQEVRNIKLDLPYQLNEKF